MVTRLARPHASGGNVVERAAILAEGTASSEILAWIVGHDGKPETLAPAAPGLGLHSARDETSRMGSGEPRRYVLPPGALG